MYIPDDLVLSDGTSREIFVGGDSSGSEGGQITLYGAGSNTNQVIDAYNNDLRILSNDSAAHTTVFLQNSDGSYAMNLNVEGTITTQDGDIYGANSAQIDLGETGSGDIHIYPDGDVSDYMYFSTASDNPGLYWENGTYDPYFLWTDATDTLSIYAADGSSTAEAISITTANITNKLPTTFDASGDVSMAYDLIFTNTTAAYASFEGGPGYVRTSHASGNYDLTLSAANSGEVVVNDDMDVDGDVQIDASGTATTNGLCHSGSDSDTTFTDRDIVACSAAPGDIAEWYDAGDSEAGDIVATTGETITYKSPAVNASTGTLVYDAETLTAAKLKRSTEKYQNNVLGVISTSPYETFGKSAIGASESPNPVALIGRVPVKVSTANGAISPGDPITSSDMAGVGMKATQPGHIIGRALDYYSNSNPEKVGKILVFVNISWYEPESYVATMNSIIEDYEAGMLGGRAAGASGWSFSETTATTPLAVVGSSFSGTSGTFSLLKTQSFTVGKDKFLVDSSGNVDIAGDLVLAGIIKGRYGDLKIKLGDSEGLKRFALLNSEKEEVFAVDSTGRISVAQDDAPVEEVAEDGAAPESSEPEVSNAVAGVGKVKAGASSVSVETSQVSEKARIQVTFRSNYSPASRYWISEQIVGESFTVMLDGAVDEDCEFDWWVVN